MSQEGSPAARTRATRARSEGLTRDRIVDAAIDLLDSDGERGLTFRALAVKLDTGHGAIQWHIQSKADLLAAATARVLTHALPGSAPNATPHEAIRDIALGVFDAIDAHPWLGSQLFAAPWRPGMVQLWERIGRPIEELGVPEPTHFTAVSTLVSYIVGAGSQNATNAQMIAASSTRGEFLDIVAARWESLDPAAYPFVRRVAARLRVHDDRREFLTGIDIILAGLPAAR